ncbi:MAG: winged helix-turn-helix domain-containing protein, partial [Terriglobia bacterium]
DIGDRLLLRDGETVPLTPKVFDILLMLVENSGRVVEKDELMKTVWPESFAEESNITQAIYTLRRVLGGGSAGDQWIETLPRRGYRFKAIAKEVAAESNHVIIEERTRSHVLVEEEIGGDIGSPEKLL